MNSITSQTTLSPFWSVETNDQELIDEGLLLDASDYIVPSTAPKDGCATKKKACKDCSCGRAEEEELEFGRILNGAVPGGTGSAVRADVVVVTNKKSSCGSCYLGDAFRCGTCPYMGMPAFKPGEVVRIGLSDDL